MSGAQLLLYLISTLLAATIFLMYNGYIMAAAMLILCSAVAAVVTIIASVILSVLIHKVLWRA
jgi:hypothetical protein